MRVLATVLIVAAVGVVIYVLIFGFSPAADDSAVTADSDADHATLASGAAEPAAVPSVSGAAGDSASPTSAVEGVPQSPRTGQESEAQQGDPPARPNAGAEAGAARTLSVRPQVEERRLVAARSPTDEPPPMDPMFERRQAIQDAVREVREGMRECYELILAVEPDIADRLVFEMSVTADPSDPERGLAELVGIESSAMIVEDVACFAGVLEELQLPPPTGDEGSYTMRYPVVLTAD